jgi:lipopolysaccharide export system protein LptC
MAEPNQHRYPYNRTWILLVLLLIAGGIAIVVLERQSTRLTDPPPMSQGEPDFIMQGAQISQFDVEGHLRYQLAAEEIRHFEIDALTRMLQPRITLHDGADAVWQVRARTGTLHRPEENANEESVTLADEVVVEQTRNGERVSLSTQSLLLYPNRQYAETDQDVTIETHVGRTTATGLKGDLRLGTISLHSTGDRRVHTIVQPEHFR